VRPNLHFISLFVFLTIIVPAIAETSPRSPADLSSAVFFKNINSKQTLRRIIRDSGKVFAGTVIKVERTDPAPTSTITTQITFRVEEAIRGVRRGQIVQIREWAGLWQAGEQYRVGEHVLLFLYPPSKLGLTSPVGGPAGRLQMDDAHQIRLKPVASHGAQTIRLKDFAAALRRAVKE
jgi:hypothetical protein